MSSDAFSLTDDGMANGQTGPHPGQPGAQMAASLGLLAVSTRANGLCNAMCYFQLPNTTLPMPGWNRISFHQTVQPASAACRQQQRSSAVSLHGSLRIRMSAILAGRLGPGVERSPSPNHNRQATAVQKRVVIQKRMQFSIVSCSYTAQCLGASCLKPTHPRLPACGIISEWHAVPTADGRLGIWEPVPGLFDPVSPVGNT